MRLDAAAKKNKYIWVTRNPEKFGNPSGVDEDLSFAEDRIAEFKKDGHQCRFGLPAEAKERAIYGGWRRLANFRRPERGCDSVRVGLDDIGIYKEDWGKVVDDPTASGGKSYLSYNTQDNITLYLRFGNVAYDSGVKYRVRVHVRADVKPGAEGEAFCASLVRNDRATTEKAVAAKEIDDGKWHWYEVGVAELSDEMEFWFRPGRFANGGGRNTVNDLYVDQVEIARMQDAK